MTTLLLPAMRRLSTVLITLLVSLMFTTMAVAGGHKAGGMPGEMRHMERLGQKLDLSGSQQQDFAALMGLYQPRFMELAKRGEADRKVLLTLAPNDASYNEMVARVSQEAGLAAAEAVVLLGELQGTVYALLTSDQQAKYLQLRNEQQQRMQNMRDKSAGGRPMMHHKGHHGDPEQCDGKHEGKHEGEVCPHHPKTTEVPAD
jgi:hypothetical protein